jgi:hypothetical protein
MIDMYRSNASKSGSGQIELAHEIANESQIETEIDPVVNEAGAGQTSD